MPTMPKKFCAFPGCHRVIPGGQAYCPEHQKKVTQNYNAVKEKAVVAHYNTRGWKKSRALYLKAHPLCVECLKKKITTQARVVDHITPHRGDEDLFWDEKNWQPLCVQCHNAKSAREWNEQRVGSEKRGGPKKMTPYPSKQHPPHGTPPGGLGDRQ